MLSLINLNCEDGSVDHSSDLGNDDVDVARSSQSKRTRRSRRNKTTSNTTLDTSQDDAQVLSSQEIASPSGAGQCISQVFQNIDISDVRTVFDTVTDNGNIHEVDNTGILSVIETMREQLCIQQKHLNSLSSQVETVLVYLQGIFDFLGIDKSLDRPGFGSQGHEGKPQHGESNPNPAVIPAPEVLSGESSSGDGDLGLSDFTRAQVDSEHNAMQRNYAAAARNGANTLQNVVREAVSRNSREQERRACSFIVSGLKPSPIINDYGQVCKLLITEFDYRPVNMRCHRVGQSHPNFVQPLLVALDSREDVSWIVANARRLRKSNDNETKVNVFINPNLSFAERSAAYRARCRRRGVVPSDSRSFSTVRSATVPAVPAALSDAEWPRLVSSVPVRAGNSDSNGHCSDGCDGGYSAGANQSEGRPIRVIINERFKHHPSHSSPRSKGLDTGYVRTAGTLGINSVIRPEMLPGELTGSGCGPRTVIRTVPVTEAAVGGSQTSAPTTVVATAVAIAAATTSADTAASESISRLSNGISSPAASGVLGDELTGAISVSASATSMSGSKDPDCHAEERRP